MNPSPRLTDDWTACPAGELQRLVRAQQTRERLRRWRQITATTAAVFLCVLGYLALATRMAPSAFEPYAGLGCQECKELFDAYHAHTLDAQLATQVRTHLDRCPKCLDAYHAQFPTPSVSATQPTPPHPPRSASFEVALYRANPHGEALF